MRPLPAVLLVDDDPTTNFLNQRLLRRLQVSREVLVAKNGQQALELLHALAQEEAVNFPALILLDVNMPVMDGFEFLEIFSQLPYPSKSPPLVVMLTTSTLDQDLVRTLQLPVADFLNKPLTGEKVEQVVGRYFDEEDSRLVHTHSVN